MKISPSKPLLAVVALSLSLIGNQTYAEDQNTQLVLPDYPPLDVFEPITQRPLFNSTRRPKPKQEDFQEDLSGSDLEENWRLVGIILNNDSPLALMSEMKGEQRLTLSKGMPLDHTWTISEIGRDYILLEGRDAQARLELWQPRERNAPKRESKKRAQNADAQQEQTPNSNTRTQRAQRAPTPAVAPGNSGTNGG